MKTSFFLIAAMLLMTACDKEAIVAEKGVAEIIGSAQKTLSLCGQDFIDSLTSITAGVITISCETEVSHNITVPEDIILKFTNNGKLVIDSGVSLTVNGGIEAGLVQIFECAGGAEVVGNPKVPQVYPEWFGAKVNHIGGADKNTQAIQHAVYLGSSLYFSKGVYYISSDVKIPERIKLTGNGLNTEINSTGMAGRIVFDYKDRANHYPALNKVSDITFAELDIVCEKVSSITFRSCYFYNTECSFNHCGVNEIIDSKFDGGKIKTFNTLAANKASEGPRITNSFLSATPIELNSTTDFTLANSHLFVEGITYRKDNVFHNALDNFFLFINNNIFDSTIGPALDLDNIAHSIITNNFVSGGRGENTSGVLLTNSKYVNFSDNIVHYCGLNGVELTDCDAINFTSNTVTSNKESGFLGRGITNTIVKDNQIGNSDIYGGGFDQKYGIFIGAYNLKASSNIIVKHNHLNKNHTAPFSIAGTNIINDENIINNP